jgi:hypothetical protein
MKMTRLPARRLKRAAIGSFNCKEVTVNYSRQSTRFTMAALAVCALATAAPDMALAQTKTKAPAILYTSALYPQGDNVAGCGATNVGAAAVQVRFELIDGGQVFTADYTIFPSVTVITNSSFGGVSFCRFTMLSGSSDSIRARLTIVNPTGTDITVSEAR